MSNCYEINFTQAGLNDHLAIKTIIYEAFDSLARYSMPEALIDFKRTNTKFRGLETVSKEPDEIASLLDIHINNPVLAKFIQTVGGQFLPLYFHRLIACNFRVQDPKIPSNLGFFNSPEESMIEWEKISDRHINGTLNQKFGKSLAGEIWLAFQASSQNFVNLKDNDLKQYHVNHKNINIDQHEFTVLPSYESCISLHAKFELKSENNELVLKFIELKIYVLSDNIYVNRNLNALEMVDSQWFNICNLNSEYNFEVTSKIEQELFPEEKKPQNSGNSNYAWYYFNPITWLYGAPADSDHLPVELCSKQLKC